MKAASIIQEESVEYKVETSSTVMTSTVREEHGMIVRREATTTTTATSVEEEEEEMEESGVEVIELEYDSAKEVIELDLGSFHAHNPHCPNCNHRITKIILRKRNIPAPDPEPSLFQVFFDYYCKICIEVVKTVVSRFESMSIIQKLQTLRIRNSESAGVIIHQSPYSLVNYKSSSFLTY